MVGKRRVEDATISITTKQTWPDEGWNFYFSFSIRQSAIYLYRMGGDCETWKLILYVIEPVYVLLISLEKIVSLCCSSFRL